MHLSPVREQMQIRQGFGQKEGPHAVQLIRSGTKMKAGNSSRSIGDCNKHKGGTCCACLRACGCAEPSLCACVLIMWLQAGHGFLCSIITATTATSGTRHRRRSVNHCPEKSISLSPHPSLGAAATLQTINKRL